MGKILCTCGQIIADQSDFIRGKAHLIADQDYMDFFDEIENKEFMEMTSKAIKYFSSEVFQCHSCNNLIFFKSGINEAIFFTPQDKNKSKQLLSHIWAING